MSNYKTALIAAVMGLLGVLVMGSLSPSVAQVVVDCNNGDVLQDAIDAAPTNETILVTGTCNENIRINSPKQKLTIDGQGAARIVAANDNLSTVSIFGRGITIQNFRVIRGGSTGIRISEAAKAIINNNTIRKASGQGIRVEDNSVATILGNRVRRNGANGISILEASAVEIGANCTEDDLNIIARNGQSGIALSSKAQATIIGNIIRNNAANGIFVSDGSMADTASNVITGNGGDGIDVSLGSSVRMGRRNEPDSCENRPNSTNLNNLNAGIGIECQSLSTVDGVLGSLDGADGATDLNDDNSDCPNCCFASVDLDPTPPANEPPEAAFTFETDNLTANFTDQSTDSDGSIVAWLWDFGDGSGSTSTEQNPSYTYAAAGTYPVTLTVEDDQGAASEPADDSVAVVAVESDCDDDVDNDGDELIDCDDPDCAETDACSDGGILGQILDQICSLGNCATDPHLKEECISSTKTCLEEAVGLIERNLCWGDAFFLCTGIQ
jgi:parallel beta-helix repeat protein